MSKPKVLVSLTTNDNDYQREQAASAEEAAKRAGVEIQIIYAENDAINQSQQLLKAIQSPAGTRPDAVVFEPVGTGLPQVAKAAVAAGMGWVILNREVDYLNELRRTAKAPVFGVTTDHTEVGRIQGRQIGALLPQGGSVLYIQGPSGSDAAQQRTNGMYEAKPDNVQVRAMKAQWTEASAYQAVSSWLRLSTSRDVTFGVISAQDDSMAAGARKAFQEQIAGANRDKWLALPFIGCDGMPDTGQLWVRQGALAATVIVPANAGQAIEMLAHALTKGTQPPERTLTVPRSYPAVDALSRKAVKV
jgi:ABC-type sugar transport system substrate-binding protein